MKILQTKFLVSLPILFSLTVFSLFNCGQKKDTENTTQNIEPAATEAQIPVVTVDSPASLPSNQSATEQATKNEIIPADKKKEAELAKKIPDKKEVPIEKKIIKPVAVTPSVQPAVVKVPEPVKTITVPQAKPVEVLTPVAVVTPKIDQSSWVVPVKYKSMTSPFSADKESLALGKSLYGTHCQSCHGSKGAGNGPKSATLDTKVGSFFSADFRAQKPGEVYYKTMFGRGDMPKYDKKIPDPEEQWAIVNYIRTF